MSPKDFAKSVRGWMRGGANPALDQYAELLAQNRYSLSGSLAQSDEILKSRIANSLRDWLWADGESIDRRLSGESLEEMAGKAPVSEALEIKARQLSGNIRHALAQIDAVHDDGNLPPLPVVEVDDPKLPGVYVTRAGTNEPVHIEVSLRGDHPELTTVHETGHFIDHMGIGAPKQFASEKDPRLKAWRKAVRESDLHSQLADLMAHKMVTVEINGQLRAYNVQPYVGYLLTDRETFARSYAQYVTLKSKDPLLHEQLERMRRFDAAAPIKWSRQWDDDDFKPIAKAFDKLFKELGWAK